MPHDNKLVKAIFFGNYFYGLCAVTLSIEAALQQFVSLNTFTYYIAVFAATTLYYTYAYISINVANPHNKRAVWYLHHKKSMQWSQIILTIVFVICAAKLLQNIWQHLANISTTEWIIILAVPIIAALYYGINLPILATKNLRQLGWLKPFVIGFVWAAMVTVYPVIYNHIIHNTAYRITLLSALLFIKNFMFVTVLCIMFDIKDYAADHNQQLKTFVVRVGLRKTIFYIIIPLSIIGLSTFILFATSRQFPLLRILINTVPFILLIIVAYSLHRRKSILYYLAIIDGLLLVKSICGITAMLYF
jgi:4-hydroxybenzoate polyprenyltransferase